ncbi:hypothetical protein SZ47_08600 [Brachyspira hyodysenteriae]|uniref:Lipoprotein n=2 Tax=Brachyspira hyodysenteriae TaxID=159 RepID=A0A3B6VC76_BRAHW|nr:hypothetical protein [Brachyspira hyodysenteriae]ACN85050.1 hypothetical protein BHWA1_02597 [Brachyspira hyodysenteriae WA1]ANN62917.1 hypothetical protein BHYOB78_03290 [Brachyspira hyodysenteriae ATCC 27164]KLI13494.1 hypothetical protein SU45_13340 [Brachyspira hyodysenteriae]KLI19687.1 hypothetical protein SU46_06260 [Brachyspira hyodysenteriae]KLI25003.1 hypothetical protein SZ47_08600 [Brachyspira hyodysenteriae]
MKFILNKLYLFIFLSLFFISCATTSKSTSSGGVYVGEDTGEIGIVNNWKNPDFKGGKTTKIIAEGYASADGRGEADAIERSIESAKRNAVEQAVGSIVNGSTLVENNRLISSKIYDNTTGYISSYKVINISKSGSVWYSKIEATVGVDMLQDNLQAMGILMDRKNLPLIVVLVTDETGNLSESFNVELEKNMSEKGFKFVSPSSLQNVMRKENISYEDTRGSRSSASIKKIADATGAQIAIIGKADAAFFTTIQGTAMKSYRSDVAITAINISDYTTIARATHQAGGVGGSDKDAHSIALVKSADYVSDDFVNQIVNKWQSEVQNGTEYTIYVSGLDFNESIGFEEALKKNIGGLKNIYNRGVSGESSRYVVTYVGSSRDLAVDINSKAKSMGYQVIISSFDDKTITLKASKR